MVQKVMPVSNRVRQLGQCRITFALSISAIEARSSGSSSLILFFRLFRRFPDAEDSERELFSDGDLLLPRRLGGFEDELEDSSCFVLKDQSAIV